jgi:hypothetical protein
MCHLVIDGKKLTIFTMPFIVFIKKIYNYLTNFIQANFFKVLNKFKIIAKKIMATPIQIRLIKGLKYERMA